MSEQSPTSHKARHSLGRSLLVWFLLLALLPLTLTAWFSYRQAVKGLTVAATQKLEREAHKSSQFIQNWFEYRFMDLNSQAENQRNAQFLVALQKELQTSDKNPAEFIKSYNWASLVDEHQQDLIAFTRSYDYIHDLFLIDNNGNILFTLTRESDLGTNLFYGPQATTRFAHSAKASLETGQTLFSDLEYYGPSNNRLAGFLTTPMLDEQGNKVGLFAIQIRLDRVFEQMATPDNETRYLVGEDGLLRTPISKTGAADVLIQHIEMEPFGLWQHKNKHGQYPDNKLVTASSYHGPNGQQVIGLPQVVSLPGVNWIMISEINQDHALAAASKLGQITLTIFLLTGTLVAVLAIFLSQRITQPIIQLADASMAVAAGEVDQQVEVKTNNEIGVLAKSFNHMLAMRKEYETALEQSSRKTKKAMDNLAEQKFALDQHSIVAITDVQGNITFANDKFFEISGYSSNEIIGQNHRLLNSGHHNTAFFHTMYQTIANGKVWHDEVCNRAKDGHLYWVDTTIVPFMSDDEKPENYIAIRTDITERKQVELDLLEAKESAEEATRLKSDFLANMSHEIRTPMNGVIGMTGLLLDTDLATRQYEYAKNTMHSAEALLTIINDILDFSKIEAGKLDLECVPFNLQTLTEDVAELMAIKCREKGIEMLLRYIPDTPYFLIGDSGRIRQILLNLLSNAVKFTEQGSILLMVELLGLTDKDATLSIKIKDTGIGIAEDKQNTIFNKFDQEDGSTTRKYGGTGLGLTISQQLCKLMQGDLQVESQKGEGSTFSFTMILALDPDLGNKGRTSPLTQENDDKLKGLRTLIVDDLKLARTIMTEQVSILQLRIDSASSGKQAIEMLNDAISEQDPFDIVIIDHHMPEMDGEILAIAIKQRKLLQNGALLFVTSSPQNNDKKRLTKMGFDGYLTKPTRPSEISQILSIIWNAKLQGHAIPLVSRHTLYEAKPGACEKFKLHNTHILLAEDNPVNQMVATEYLEGYGCHITPAGNGLEAVAMIKDRQFDLILMDCQMPEMDGFEATAEIRHYESTKTLNRSPIIAFTANAMQSDKEQCLAAGMDDFISKPVSREALERVLKTWLPHKLSIEDLSSPQPIKEQNTEEKTGDDSTKFNSILNLSIFNQLKKLFGNKFEAAIHQNFMTSEKNIMQAQDAIQAKDQKTLERAMHSLKSSSRQFGALKLGDIAADIETHAAQNNLDAAKEAFAILRAIYKQVEKQIEQQSGYSAKPINHTQTAEEETSRAPAQNKILTEEESLFLNEQIQQLAQSLQEGDYIDPETVSALGSLLPTDQQQNLAKLKEQVSSFDAESAIETLKKITSTQ